LPSLVAVISSILLVIDWYLSIPGIAEQIDHINRALGIIVMLFAAFLASQTLVLREKLRRDDWIRSARARVSEAVLGEQSLPVLAERVLKILVECLDAQAGAMYVADASGANRHARRAGGLADAAVRQTGRGFAGPRRQ
jgi:hypothetical protein